MEGDAFSGLNNISPQMDAKLFQNFQESFIQVQSILDQNRVLITQINQNHESKIPDNLSRNAKLIRNLNNNISRVADLYTDISASFNRSMEASSDGDSSFGSDGKPGMKKIKM